MTMADRNWKQKDSDTSPTLDPQYVSLIGAPLSLTSAQPDKDASNRTPHSSSPEIPELSRGGDYSIDLSPATTASSTTTKPSQEHFKTDNLSPCQVIKKQDKISSLHSLKINAANSNTHDQTIYESSWRSPPGATQSSFLSRSADTPNRRRHKSSSRSLSESSDTNLTQFHLESDNEDDITKVHSAKAPISPTLSRVQFSLSENLQTVHSGDIRVEDDEDENVFNSGGNVLTNWGISSEPQTPRRKNSVSLRERRFCSHNSDYGDDLAGACGGFEPEGTNDYFDTGLTREQRSRSLIESSHGGLTDLFPGVRKVASGGAMGERYHHSFDNIRCNDSLFGSQDFQADYFESDFKDIDTCPVFPPDPARVNGDGDKAASSATPGTSRSRAVVIVQNRPRGSSISSSRQRRVGVTSIRLSGGFMLPWPSPPNEGVSVSTQTPHVTSVMIQQIIDTPVALPNEARGTAASRLHRRSESGVPLPPLPTPLPDIITSVRRDRSHSVPNLQSLAIRQRARIVGQELRLISDEFNCRRSLTPVHEEFDGHPASYPRMHPSYVRNTITQFGTLLRDTFRGRQNT